MLIKEKVGRSILVLLIVGLACSLMSAPGFSVKTIRYWTSETGPVAEETDFGIIRSFEEKYPDVRIIDERMPFRDMWMKLMASIRAGTEPEVIYIGPQQAMSLYAKGHLLPLNDVADRIGRDKFVSGLLNPLIYEGNVFAIPAQAGSKWLFYREDLFAEKGLALPIYRNELLTLAEKLTEDIDGDGNMDRYGYAMDGMGAQPQVHFFTGLWRKGGYYFDEDNNIVFDTKYFQESMEVLDYLEKLSKFCPPGLPGYGYSEIAMAYYSDKAAMISYYGRLPSILESSNPEIGSVTKAVVPPMDEKVKKVGVYAVGDTWVMLKNSKYPDVGKDFIYHYMTGENYIRFLSSAPLHMFPSHHTEEYFELFNQLPMWQKYASIWDTMVKALSIPGAPFSEYTEHPGVLNPYVGDVRGSRTLSDEITAFYAGDISAEEVIRNGSAAWRDIIARLEKQ